MLCSVSVRVRSVNSTPINEETRMNLGLLTSFAVGLAIYQKVDQRTSDLGALIVAGPVVATASRGG